MARPEDGFGLSNNALKGGIERIVLIAELTWGWAALSLEEMVSAGDDRVSSTSNCTIPQYQPAPRPIPDFSPSPVPNFP
eukprot:2126323-Rhodomonas_salina.5